MSLLSAQEVMDIIPNRYPIFFIDKVEELNPRRTHRLLQKRNNQRAFFPRPLPWRASNARRIDR